MTENYDIELFFSTNERCHDLQPLITVITPYYNNKNLLVTVKSVLQQDYLSIEYIIADDGSTAIDEVCTDIRKLINTEQKLNFREIKMIKQKQNVGTVKNLNTALRNSSGEYIFILSANDKFVSASILREWVDVFLTNDAMVSTAKRYECLNNIDQIQCIRPLKRQIRNITSMEPIQLYHTMKYHNYISGACTAYRRDCFEKYGYFDERYRLIEDQPMILKLLKQGVSISFWDKAVIYYMKGGISSLDRMNPDFEKDVEFSMLEEAKYCGENAESIITEYRKNRKKLIVFFSFWEHREYIRAFFVYPKQAVKELLRPIRAMMIKTIYG